ncbi:unnamed protein product [Tenebrio molitor]|nr:unnamed protein product [Tenebrio molitor]
MTFVANFVNNLYRGASFSFKFDNFSRNSIRFVQKWCKTVSKSISAQCPLIVVGTASSGSLVGAPSKSGLVKVPLYGDGSIVP